MLPLDILLKIGISEKAAHVYMALLTHGPSSVRRVAEICEINRGSAYDYMKQLEDAHLVLHIEKSGRQQFAAEHPRVLERIVQEKTAALVSADVALRESLPELEALYNSGGEKPIARYIERDDLADLLRDVLLSCERARMPLYRIYSAEAVRPYLYESFPGFSDERVKRGIAVKSIAFGGGGALRGLDERRILTRAQNVPTYIILYPKKIAAISLSLSGEPVGVVIENEGIATMQTAIFDALWETLFPSV